MGAGGAPAALHPTASSYLIRAQKAGRLPAHITPGHVKQTKALSGKILVAKGGDVTSALRRSPVVGDAVREPISRMTAQQRVLHNALIKRHEMGELGVKGLSNKGPSAFSQVTGHMGAGPPLNDSNILATLPRGSGAVSDTVRAYRPIESLLLERATRGVGGRPGMEFGKQRLSRHARKRVGNIMENLATDDLKEALSRPDGKYIKASLKGQGITHIPGIGDL